ncbi:MAG: hypothetical protein O2974_08195 [Chloroflexi bacterium]|nr:hypothetical protein [Chloroflexota bacterium]
MAELLSKSAFRPMTRIGRDWNPKTAEVVMRDSMMAGIVLLLGIWAIPFITNLLKIGEFSVPIPIIILLALGLIFARSVVKLHSALQTTLAQTMLGQDPAKKPAEESSLPTDSEEN